MFEIVHIYIRFQKLISYINPTHIFELLLNQLIKYCYKKFTLNEVSSPDSDSWRSMEKLCVSSRYTCQNKYKHICFAIVYFNTEKSIFIKTAFLFSDIFRI